MSIAARRKVSDPLQPLTKALGDAAAKLLSNRVAAELIGDVRLALDEVLRTALARNAEVKSGTLLYIAENQSSIVELELGNDKTINQGDAEEYISTEEAAQILDCSRPHIAMLCDAGEIHGVTKSYGGHRRIPLSSIMELKQAQNDMLPANYKKASREMGLYEIPEETFLKPTR